MTRPVRVALRDVSFKLQPGTGWHEGRIVSWSHDVGLMGAEADALCGAAYGERSPERVNRRNGYRERDWDTRVGSIELAVPKLREGSYFPDWLLQPRRRAEQAFVSVIADAYLAGVSTRRFAGDRPRSFICWPDVSGLSSSSEASFLPLGKVPSFMST